MSKIIVLSCLWLLILAGVSEGQSVSGLVGTVSTDSSVTISGTSFGANGPTIDTFCSFTGSAGTAVDANTPEIGVFSAGNGGFPDLVNDGLGGIAAGSIIENTRHNVVVNFSDATEVYISYRVMVPDGSYWQQATAEETFASTNGPWKMLWMYDDIYGDGANGNDDLVLCSAFWYGASGAYRIVGNDGAFGHTAGTLPAHWSWDYWNRFSFYLKAGSNPSVDTGYVWTQIISEENGQYSTSSPSYVLFDGDDNAEDDDVFRWNQLNVTGYHEGNNGGVNTNAYYDDIYVATGDYARARVEVGDNQAYSSCTKLDICTPTSWSDTSIDVTLRLPQFSNDETAYLFVVDADGNISSGYPVTIGSTPSATLNAPTNLSATRTP